MNLSKIPPAFVLALIAGLVWGVRLEGRVNQVDKDNKRLEKDLTRVESNSTKTNEEILKTTRELQASVAALNIEITKVISELKHTRR